MRNHLRLLAVSAALTLSGGLTSAATTTIGPGATPSAGEGTLYPVLPDQQGQGQTFVVPAGFPILQSFAFNLGISGPGNETLTFEVFEWDGVTTTGAALVSSTIPGLATTDPIFIGALALTPGSSYLAFLRGGLAQPMLGLALDVPIPNPYASGVWVYQDANGDFQTLISSRLGDEGPWDARFEAVFATNPVPEPATLFMLGGGFAAMAIFQRARRSGSFNRRCVPHSSTASRQNSAAGGVSPRPSGLAL